MNFWQRGMQPLLGHSAPEGRRVYGIQFLLLFVLSTLLYFGFPGTREWRRVAEEDQLHTIIRGWDGLSWFTWLAAAPFMMLLVRRFPLVRGWQARDLARLAIGCLVIYLAVTHVRYVLRIFEDSLGSGNYWGVLTHFGTYTYNTFAMLPLDLLTFSGFFAVSFALDAYYKNQRDAQQTMRLQVRAAELQSDLARAELAALRGQLHPHFLFNSFNALATLVRQHKNDAAVEIIAQLSALLRLAIDRSGLHEIPLEQEIDFIRRYLDIEQVRFGDKLRVAFVLEPAAMAASIANIVLQPLVENAIKHGISLRTSPGTVRVSAGRSGDRLRIEIANDGPEELPDIRSTKPRKPGIGLANARAQLDKIYGGDYRLELATQPSGITLVTLDVPWRRAELS